MIGEGHHTCVPLLSRAVGLTRQVRAVLVKEGSEEEGRCGQ